MDIIHGIVDRWTFYPAGASLLDLTGKVVIVTGGNTGIGYWTVLHLARKGAKIYLAARNETKALDAIKSITEAGIGSGEVIWLPFDLKDPRLAKKAAEDFLSREKRLDVLINNAAFLTGPYNADQDGVSEVVMTNHISTFLFTQTLLPLMIEASKMPDSDVRLVNVASDAHINGPSANPDIRFQSIDDFNGEYKEMFWPDSGRYGVSKLMNVIYTTELQRRLSTKSIPITCISLHPGSVDTGRAWRTPYPRLATIVFKIFFIGPDQRAYTSCFAAASPLIKADPDKYKGQYIRPVGRIVAKNPNVAKAGLAEELWETTEKFLRGLGLYTPMSEWL
ncbi:NAD-P-binding protein [Guyanagaster necrorhizus]|uniref:NAD-P-binding protein n=1 Tax=Guyanagaster necrorhizus TaxID=856835 RepID=A0A9P8ASW7_9AGAR|nr:NAD-P-binding protein [Guyanagaster necrorhizus MCA 3950]KAG7446779.1 NAD-P-binding protein [Guyanagaster necrorhizus MCA 3950]